MLCRDSFHTMSGSFNSPVLVFFDNLVYGDFERDVFIFAVTVVFIDAELGRGHSLAIRNLSQVKTELFVMSPLVGEIPVPLHCKEAQERKKMA